MIRTLLATCALLAAAPAAWAGCGPSPDPCATDLGSYQAELPRAPDRDMPVVIFLHGYGSSGANVMRNRGMVDAFLARGYAVVAPDGVPRAAGGRPGWNFRGDPGGRDEIAFLTGVLADAAARFGLNPDAALLAGFSSGAFMVNYLACAAPQSFCIAAVHWVAGPGAGAGAGAGGLGLGPLPHSHHVAPLLEILVQPGQQTSQS